MRLKLMSIAALLLLALAACGGESEQANVVTEVVSDVIVGEGPGDEMAGAAALPAIDPLEVTGDIAVAGSSTVFPLAGAGAE